MDDAIRPCGEQLRRQPGRHGGGRRQGVRLGDPGRHRQRVQPSTPTTSAGPRLLVRGLGDAIGSDGSVYYESTDHHLAVAASRRRRRAGPVLAHTPNGLGGGVQYVDVVAGGAGVGDRARRPGPRCEVHDLRQPRPWQARLLTGAVTSSVVDSATGPLVLVPPATSRRAPRLCRRIPASCVLCIDPHGVMSDASGGSAAVTLIGPGPAVVVSDTYDGPVRPGAAVIAGPPGQ